MWSIYLTLSVLLIYMLFLPAEAKTRCTDLTIPVTVTAPSFTLSFPQFQNSYQAISFVQQVVKRDISSNPVALGPNRTKTFSISAQYCTPTSQRNSKTLQILSHGLGFDKSYWDFNLVSGNYSYVDTAAAAGYSTFSYDRLGNGKSTKADPYTTVQGPVELAILIKMTKMLRSGAIHGIDKHEKYVHVGHSFGFSLTNALVVAAPSLSDGIVLTGYSNNLTFQTPFISTTNELASENQPTRLGNLASGYLTWANKYSNQFAFLAYPYFDPAVLIAAEANKWPFTVGEILSGFALNFAALEYKGPVLYLAAQYDNIFCGGDCAGIIDGPYSVSKSLFPAVSDFEVYVQPNVGHGINLHYNATGAYAVANSFFKKNGL